LSAKVKGRKGVRRVRAVVNQTGMWEQQYILLMYMQTKRKRRNSYIRKETKKNPSTLSYCVRPACLFFFYPILLLKNKNLNLVVSTTYIVLMMQNGIISCLKAWINIRNASIVYTRICVLQLCGV
jgi:hypothetical protein